MILYDWLVHRLEWLLVPWLERLLVPWVGNQFRRMGREKAAKNQAYPCISFYYGALHCTALHNTALHCTALHCRNTEDAGR